MNTTIPTKNTDSENQLSTIPNALLNYALAIISGTYSGIKDSLEMIWNPIDNFLYPVSELLFDAIIVVRALVNLFI